MVNTQIDFFLEKSVTHLNPLTNQYTDFMRTYVVLLAVFLFLTLVPPGMAALEVSVTPATASAPPEGIASYDLIITNTGDAIDNVSVTMSGPHLEWFQSGSFLLAPVPAKGIFAAKVILYPVGMLFGRFPYTVNVDSYLNSSSRASASFALDVAYNGNEDLLSVTAALRGDRIVLSFVAAAPRKAVLPITVKIRNAAKIVGEFSIQEEVENIKTFEKTITLQKSLPVGTYVVEASLSGSSDKKTASLVVEPFRKVVTEEATIKGSWYDEVIITVTNTGNVQEEKYVLNYPVPADRLTGFVTATEGCVMAGTEKTCSFALPPLAPGETARVVYRIEYWPSLAGFAAGGVLLALVAGFGVVASTRPRIIKKAVRRKGDITHVMLEVHSPRLREARAVMVRDFVSPMAEVQYREFESLKPVIRKTEAGTELIWKLGDMKAREQRILSYKVKPLVEGQLKMPRAYVKYSTADEKRYQLFSRGLTVFSNR